MLGFIRYIIRFNPSRISRKNIGGQAMTDEEKMAVEYLKNYKYDNEVYKSIQIVLNLIEKQDKIIKQQSYTNKKMRNKLKNYRKLLKLKDKTIANFEKELARLSEKNLDLFRQNEKQDKMINEMAEMLVKVPKPLDDDVHTLAVIRYINEHLEEKKQQVIEYFSKKVGE
jgi:cysteinyl-tRNA synthetase